MKTEKRHTGRGKQVKKYAPAARKRSLKTRKRHTGRGKQVKKYAPAARKEARKQEKGIPKEKRTRKSMPRQQKKK
ncbi:MAG: hypothetical protein PUE95_03685 [Lachnospiraceae bacterium]|nr:hypothetical protein [Lachnospiraceae bacterium]